MTLKVVRGATDAPRDRDVPKAVNQPTQSVTQAANEQVKALTGVASQRLSAEAVVVTGRAKVDSSEKVRDSKGAQNLADRVSGEIRKDAGEAKGAHSGLTSASGRTSVE